MKEVILFLTSIKTILLRQSIFEKHSLVGNLGNVVSVNICFEQGFERRQKQADDAFKNECERQWIKNIDNHWQLIIGGK